MPSTRPQPISTSVPTATPSREGDVPALISQRLCGSRVFRVDRDRGVELRDLALDGQAHGDAGGLRVLAWAADEHGRQRRRPVADLALGEAAGGAELGAQASEQRRVVPVDTTLDEAVDIAVPSSVPTKLPWRTAIVVLDAERALDVADAVGRVEDGAGLDRDGTVEVAVRIGEVDRADVAAVRDLVLVVVSGAGARVGALLGGAKGGRCGAHARRIERRRARARRWRAPQRLRAAMTMDRRIGCCLPGFGFALILGASCLRSAHG